MPDQLLISLEFCQQISEYLTHNLPEEACGLLAGDLNGVVSHVIPITNKAHSPNRYRMDELELLRAFEFIDRHHLSLLAIFHSHPVGPKIPSFIDLLEYQYPDSIMVIFSLLLNNWQSFAYRINPFDRSYKEVQINRIHDRI